ncbi:MAG TPA: DUF1415 family protein [Polyangia bacterium]|nr:DUF1415 family protein [Polyangia bacterium]
MNGGAPSPADRAWTDEALRLNARYIEEVVIGWGLCPWAAQAWRTGAVRRRVLLDPAPDPAPVLEVIAQLDEPRAPDAPRGRDPAPQAAIGLVIWPRLALDAAAFASAAEQIRRADRARRPPGAAPPFLIAAFHPDLRPEPPADAASLVPFIRRTPDPTLQLVRTSLLDALAGGGRDVSAEIAAANFVTVAARTPAALDQTLADIRRDRDDSYRRLRGL